MKLEELLHKQVKCLKVDYITYEDHPNNIQVGHVETGKLVQLTPFIAITSNNLYFYSSEVQKIEGNFVYTENSVYEITELKEEEGEREGKEENGEED